MSSDRSAGSLVYLSGAPASGKSTLMARLTRYCVRHELTPNSIGPARDLLHLPRPAALTLASSAAIELGRRREAFSGTDALPMNAVIAAEQFISTSAKGYSLILGEGDRLANRRFLLGARDAGWDVTLIHLDAPAPVLDARCRDRGSTQSAGWRAGRETKAVNLATQMLSEGLRVHLFPTHALHTSATTPADTIAAVSAAVVRTVPVLAALLPPDAPEVQP